LSGRQLLVQSEHLAGLREDDCFQRVAVLRDAQQLGERLLRGVRIVRDGSSFGNSACSERSDSGNLDSSWSSRSNSP
jgi:hypothetical protein